MTTNLRCFVQVLLCASFFSTNYASAETDSKKLVSFAVNKSQVSSGDKVQLSWSAQDARFCLAQGDWEGKLATQGEWQSPPILADQTFELFCRSAAGDVTRKVVVTVGSSVMPIAAAAAAPLVDLQSSQITVGLNGTTDLSWSATAADQCEAGGGWAGSKALTGTETVGPIASDTSFSLSCNGVGGTTLEIVSVQVANEATANASLTWQPPTTNEDGSKLEGLAGYIIYYGLESQFYTDNIEVNVSNISGYDLALTPGTYYVAMRAVGVGGELSALSNEVLLSLP